MFACVCTYRKDLIARIYYIYHSFIIALKCSVVLDKFQGIILLRNTRILLYITCKTGINNNIVYQREMNELRKN